MAIEGVPSWVLKPDQLPGMKVDQSTNEDLRGLAARENGTSELVAGAIVLSLLNDATAPDTVIDADNNN